MIEETLKFIRSKGLYVGVGLDLAGALSARTGTADKLGTELIQFVTIESSQRGSASVYPARRKCWSLALES